MKEKRFHVARVVMSISVLLVSCGSTAPTDFQEGWEKKANEFTAALMDQYDPIVFPPEVFAKTRVFTYNLRRLLASGGSRPVLFDGFLEDVTEEGDQMFVDFTCKLSTDPTDDRVVRFRLKCSHAAARSLVEKPLGYSRSSKYLFLKGIRKDFLVVCNVTNVSRVENYAVGMRRSQGPEYEDLKIILPDTFRVDGELLKMVKYSDMADR